MNLCVEWSDPVSEVGRATGSFYDLGARLTERAKVFFERSAVRLGEKRSARSCIPSDWWYLTREPYFPKGSRRN